MLLNVGVKQIVVKPYYQSDNTRIQTQFSFTSIALLHFMSFDASWRPVVWDALCTLLQVSWSIKLKRWPMKYCIK